MSHTPTPWKLWPHRENLGPIICTGDSPLTYEGICTVSGGPDIANANAEFILRACNNHEALVAACQSALWAFDQARKASEGAAPPPSSNTLKRELEAAVSDALPRFSKRTRSGEHKKPFCPHGCGNRLRVKPAPRTKDVQLWECVHCKKTRPADECEWTNSGLQMANGEL